MKRTPRSAPISPLPAEISATERDLHSKGDPKRLTQEQRETVDAVLEFYGDKSSQWLSDMTHREKPWVDARIGLAPLERGSREISHEAMADYYSILAANNS